ncbi:hypothetical protein FGG08_000758 [Glutinoglossum americanum]|uniref:Putative transcription factor kapC n=1 Tax=Glutinoglossum americanum TaxID=1670608 RepID=A0A9P8I399_9PEZI|nr:hypothetical protein FGG08_000758 [Glutinoglossum americanum]
MNQHYKNPPPRTFQYALLPFDSPNVYDNLSDESNAGSPRSYEQVFHGLGALDYPVYSYSGPATGFIVRPPNVSPSLDDEIDGEHALDGGDRRKRRLSSARDKDSLSQIHSRRRAQNRASQRAFRDRKEKHVKDLERRFEELEGKHKTLQQSYSELSSSQDALKGEIETLEAENELLRRTGSIGGSFRGMLGDQDFERVSLDGSLLYSGPTFYFDNDLLDTHKEISPCHVDDAM